VWDGWDLSVELLAQLVEVVSVGAADKKIGNPIRLPRPDRLNEPAPRAAQSPEEFSRATDAVILQFASRMGGVGKGT
jgi:hypothetical protein